MRLSKLLKTFSIALMCIFILSSCLLSNNEYTAPPNDQSEVAPSQTKEINNPELTLEPTITQTITPAIEEVDVQDDLPRATSRPSACLLAGGNISTASLATEDYLYPLDYIVYTPPCYLKDFEEDYPVLYFFHGQSYRQDQWINLGAAEVADRLIASGDMAPLIMVMPRDRVWKQPSEDIFGAAVMNILIPYIDENYRTKNDREFRAVGGVSRGGAWSIYLGLKNWDVFSIVGLHSPALFWDHEGMVPTWIAAIPPDKMPRIFVDIRKYEPWEIESSIIDIETGLNLLDITHEFYRVDGYHKEEYWSQDIEKYMRFYTLDW